MRFCFPAAAAAIMIATIATGASAQDAAPSLPGGASSLQETFQDWRVTCGIVNQAKICTLSQQQVRQQDNQRLLAVELRPAPGDTVTGTLVLPFGLKLAAGVTMQVDDNAPVPPAYFSTCIPAGCLVPLTLDTAQVEQLRAGTAVKLIAQAADTSQEVTFSISLKGFSGALDRVVALVAS